MQELTIPLNAASSIPLNEQIYRFVVSEIHEGRLKQGNRQLRLLGQYYQTKAMYLEYVKTGKSKNFHADHRAELDLHDAAVKELREIYGTKKLPTIQSLKAEKAELTKRKQAQYECYKSLRMQWLELSKLARNRDSMLSADHQNKQKTI